MTTSNVWSSRLISVVTALGCALTWTRGVSAQTTVASVDADAFVSAARPESNFGGGGLLAVSAAGLPNGEFQSLIRFDTAAVAAHFDTLYGAGRWSVYRVRLSLNATPPSNSTLNPASPGSVAVRWIANDAWIEGTGTPRNPTIDGVTWSTLPQLSGPTDEPIGAISYAGQISGRLAAQLTLAPLLLDDIENGRMLTLRLSAGDAAVSAVFNSRSFFADTNRPQLTVSVAPTIEALVDLLQAIWPFTNP